MDGTNYTELELDDIYAFATQLGKDAGKMLMDAIQRRTNPDNNDKKTMSVDEKESSVDIVTKTDHGTCS
jgi:myo-inositol-1(or 4)-monophosphatase